jgi:UrcA family protein
MSRSLAPVAAGLAVALFAQAVGAQSAMVVRLRGLDLQTRSGAAIALQRMDDSARQFCRNDDPAHLDVTAASCRRDMTSRAVRKLSARDVTRLYMAASPGGFQTATR